MPAHVPRAGMARGCLSRDVPHPAGLGWHWQWVPPALDAHLGRAPPSPQPLLPPQVCGEKNRFEKLMEYFRNEDSNIDFMVSGGGGWGPRCAPCPPRGWRHLGTHGLLPWWQLPWSPQACPWLCPKGCQVPKVLCPQELPVPPQGVVSQGLLSSWPFPRSPRPQGRETTVLSPGTCVPGAAGPPCRAR